MKFHNQLLISSLFSFAAFTAQASDFQCPTEGVYLQVLGAGGPELTSDNASTSYLLWDDGKPKILIDAGPSTAQNFIKTGAKIADLDAILISHMHVDHVADLISLIKSSYFETRDSSLPIYGPTGNHLTPSMTEYMERLLGLNGLFPYLNNFIAEAPDETFSKANYKIHAHDIAPTIEPTQLKIGSMTLESADAMHGGVPALAWSISYKGKTVFVTGDSSGPKHLASMAKSADLIIAHNALPESYSGHVEKLHMKPSTIADIVADSQAHTLVFSHFLAQTNKSVEQANTQEVIEKSFRGKMSFANDFNCYAL
ncbi:MBL fold metallo-hydrolase [Vibrio astriarenae]